LAKRVFEIAKELGIKSKAIVEKCRAEGIPESVIKNHMSTASAGLEATFREWFSVAEEGHGTAIETTEHVDIEKVRAKPARRAKPIRKKVEDAPAETTTDSGGDTSVSVAEPEAVETTSETATDQKPAASTKAAASTPDDQSDTPVEASDKPDENGQAPVADEPVSPPAAPTKAPTRAPTTRRTVPAPMNVPTRPQTITPAGPKLEQKEVVKLAGPKVVRVEAPEPVDTRPRRAPRPGGGYGGGGGGGSGGGYGGAPGGAPPMAPGDDRGRSPRRGGKGRRGAPSQGGGQGGGSSWSQQDLAERQARLQHAGGYLRQRRQQLQRSEQERSANLAQAGGKVSITEPFTIKELSAVTGVKGADIVKQLFMQGVMATINSGIDTVKAQEIMLEYNIELDVVEAKSAEERVAEAFDDRERVDERPRGPVVTILGHVDHGKTSLLDRIRKANVADGEAGGITQATSAFRVPLKFGDEEKFVVFIDTPGHEAFTAMRARGAHVTDIVVLVVAADDGVMPQTIESISHAKAAGVPIIVALNKMDKPEATDDNIQRILGQLAEHGLNPTDWGGETEVVRTSAVKNEGIEDLLEILDLQAQVLEIMADFDGPARGTVIESKPEEGRGSVASILIQEGQLKVGDFVVMGRGFGRVRDITDDRGKKLKLALPPMPVQVSGIDELPDAGDKFFVTDSLKKAQEAAEQRRSKERHEQLAQPKVTLDSLFSQIAETELKEILVVLKADVQGSVDVIRHEVEKISTDEVKVRVLHAAVGGVTESDVILAEASKAIIVGFNVIPSGKARRQAEDKGVEIRSYRVIYDITNDLHKAAEGLLTPDIREEVIGHAEVRQVFKVSKVGSVAGCYVTDGIVMRDALIRVTRNDIVVEHDRKLEQLKRFKDDAKEVRSGMECGMKIHAYDDIKEGDILECYKKIEVKRTLS
jgi:translation initiation factor IF-2